MQAFYALLLLFSTAFACPPPPSNHQVNSDVVGDEWANLTLDEASVMNYKWYTHDSENLCSATCDLEVPDTQGFNLGWCHHKGLSSKGKYKLASIGNSFAANHGNLFYQECGFKAKSILQGSANGCEPLYPSTGSEVCQDHVEAVVERIEKEKPDYAFIFTRYISIGDLTDESDFAKDPIYQFMKSQMLKLTANIKYKLYIMDALPQIEHKMDIAQELKNVSDPVEADKVYVILEPTYQMARKRHAQLVKDCNGKCELIDYTPLFFNQTTQTYRFFDEKGLAYYTGHFHMSPHGLEHVRPFWKDFCAKL